MPVRFAFSAALMVAATSGGDWTGGGPAGSLEAAAGRTTGSAAELEPRPATGPVARSRHAARAGVRLGSGRTKPALLSDDFESYATGVWPEGSSDGPWRVIYNGFGSVGIEAETSKVLFETPRAAASETETHAALVASTRSFGDIDYSVRVHTVAQLRPGAPNAWEVAWVLWHYTDDTHFYYFIPKPNGWELGKADAAYPGAQRFLATGSSPSYPVGAWYTVRVRQTGGSITVWVDGVPVVAFSDTERPYTSGSVALYTEDASVRFDDVAVRRA